MQPDRRLLLRFYGKMLKIRRFEERVSEMYLQGLIPGWIHSSIGQEAVAVGVCENLRNDDWILTGHRGHGHAIAKGMPLRELAAELLGRETGCCRGRGGSMHLISSSLRILATSFVGSGTPIAAGLALSLSLQPTDAVVVLFAGDGAVNTGAFHEGMNLVGVWKLPLVCVVENNLYAISTPVSKSTAVKEIAERATAYGMQPVSVDGNDVLTVHHRVKQAVDRARRERLPAFIECRTYRQSGHYEGEKWEVYRKREEVEAWRQRCSIRRLRERLREAGVGEDEAEAQERAVMEEVEEAIRYAQKSPSPRPEEFATCIYS